MKVYLAAMYSLMTSMQFYHDRLRNAGHEPTSRWVDGNEEGTSCAEAAAMDLIDIERADVLILFTNQKGTMFKSGGRFVELGYAIGIDKRIIVVGDYENVFIHLPEIERVDTFTQALRLLKNEED